MSPSDSTVRRSAEVPVMVAPYASPLSTDAPSMRGGTGVSVKAGPYIPAPWRGRPSLERPVAPLLPALASEEPRTAATLGFGTAGIEAAGPLAPPVTKRMPWIDAFLASTPALPMRAIEPPTPLVEPAFDRSFMVAMADTGFAEPSTTALPSPQSVPASEFDSDDWALGEAVHELEALAHDLHGHESSVPRGLEPSGLFESAAMPEFLPAWSDDDLTDLMPRSSVRASGQSPSGALRPLGPSATPQVSVPAVGVEPWADRARRSGDAGAEAAARALELLARRVRDGELSLTGYEPRLGDAAVLAAALAALLGVRPA